MSDDRTELDRVIQGLQRMEQAERPNTAAGGSLNAARTILEEPAAVIEFGGSLNDDPR